MLHYGSAMWSDWPQTKCRLHVWTCRRDRCVQMGKCTNYTAAALVAYVVLYLADQSGDRSRTKYGYRAAGKSRCWRAPRTVFFATETAVSDIVCFDYYLLFSRRREDFRVLTTLL